MTLTLKSEDAVASLLEHVAQLIRLRFVKSLSLEMHDDGRISRANITFRLDPPAEEVAALKKLEE